MVKIFKDFRPVKYTINYLEFEKKKILNLIQQTDEEVKGFK